MKAEFVQGFLFAIWLVYIVFKDVAVPLFRLLRNRKQSPTSMTVLEVNLQKLETRVTDFERLLAEQGTAVDNKLDLILDEMRQFGERMARMETHFEHIQKDVEDLKATKRRGGIGD